MKRRYTIVGAGAVGCYYGGRLAEAGHDVHFLLRSDYEAVRKNGLRVESSDGDFFLPNVSCAQTPEEIGPVDVIIVAWKTTANEHFEKTLTPLLHQDTVILTLQNGLGNVEQLGNLFGPERILGALCFVCINRIEPGLIRHTAGGLISIGGQADLLPEIAECFQNAKVPCHIAENLPLAQWRKLVWNVPFNGLCITEGGIDTEELLQRPGMEEQVRELMQEVITSASALGLEIPESFIDEQVERTRPMGPYRPSSMIDYVKGFPVEVEAIWGEPLRRAQAAGVPVPAMEALYQNIRTLCS